MEAVLLRYSRSFKLYGRKINASLSTLFLALAFSLLVSFLPA